MLIPIKGAGFDRENACSTPTDMSLLNRIITEHQAGRAVSRSWI